MPGPRKVPQLPRVVVRNCLPAAGNPNVSDIVGDRRLHNLRITANGA